MNLGGDELVLILYITVEKRPVLVMCINYNIYVYTCIKFVHEEFIFIQYNIYLYIKVLKHIIVNISKKYTPTYYQVCDKNTPFKTFITSRNKLIYFDLI